MAKYYNSDKAGEPRAMLKIQLFDADAIETGRFHFVFCLDESGSMSGSDWQTLMRTYVTFINKRRNDQEMGDVVSTITFSTGYRTHHTVVPIDQVSTQIDFASGGTLFGLNFRFVFGGLITLFQLFHTPCKVRKLSSHQRNSKKGSFVHTPLSTTLSIYHFHKSKSFSFRFLQY
jgi:hypothetical protein